MKDTQDVLVSTPKRPRKHGRCTEIPTCTQRTQCTTILPPPKLPGAADQMAFHSQAMIIRNSGYVVRTCSRISSYSSPGGVLRSAAAASAGAGDCDIVNAGCGVCIPLASRKRQLGTGIQGGSKRWHKRLQEVLRAGVKSSRRSKRGRETGKSCVAGLFTRGSSHTEHMTDGDG